MPRKREALPETYNDVFPVRLRRLLKDKGETQQELADYLGCTRQMISYYSDGSSSPNVRTIVKIAEYFNVTTDYLLGVKSEAKSEKNKSVFACRLSALSIGKTQKEIGDALGVSRATIGYYQNDERHPDIIALARIARYFGVSSDYLIGLTDDPTPHTPNIPITSNADIAALLNEIATIAQFRATRIKNEEEG